MTTCVSWPKTRSGQGADAIGMAGGDGSQALVASVAAQAGIPYVCVPAGTRNHFALDLGLNRDDVVGALDAFADGVEQRIDLATVNGRTFVNNASLGLYAKVVQSPEYRDAKLRTAAAMLPDLLGPAADPLDLSFTGPGGEEHHTAQLILISNNPYQLVPMEGGAGTRERLDTGLLGIVAITISDAAGANAFFALQALGQANRYPGWMEWTAPRFEITSAAEVEIGVDGEALRMTPPVVFEIQPGALRVRLPRHALRKSPAARTVHVLSRSTVAGLARVASGASPHRPEPGRPASSRAAWAGLPARSGHPQLGPDRQVVRPDRVGHFRAGHPDRAAEQQMVQLDPGPVGRVGPAAHGGPVPGRGQRGQARHVQVADDDCRAAPPAAAAG